MDTRRIIRRAAATGLAAVAVAAALPAGAGHADTLCTSTGNYVYDWPSYNASRLYSIAAGGAFQWTGFVSGEFYQGRYPGQPRDGFFPSRSLRC